MSAYQTVDLKDNHVLEIHIDESPLNPRHEWDNTAIMACFHSKYDIGDKDIPFEKDDFGSQQEMGEYILSTESALTLLPLYIYEHGGITMNTTGFNCKWDSGQVGFIYITQVQLNLMGITQGNGDGLFEDETDQQFEDRLKLYMVSEVETYDQYLRGDVYGFELLDPKGNNIDSCSGFYGDDWKENGIKDHIDPNLILDDL